MTISTTDYRISYVGAGTTGPFTIPFKFIENTHILAIKRLTADGTETVLALDVDYSLSGAGDNDGGTLTLMSSLSASYEIHIVLDPDLLQGIDLRAGDPFPAEIVEEGLDKVTQIAGRAKDLASRSFRLSDSSPSTINTEVPPPEAGKFWRWNLFGTNVDYADAVYDNGDFLQSGAGAVARTVDSKLAEVVSIMDFGGVKDGTGDNKAAADAASAAVSAKGGGTVFFPAGTYNFATVPAEIPSGVSWVPEGHLITTLKQDCAMSAGQGFIKLGGVDHYIGDFVIDAAATRTNGHAIQMIATSSSGKGSFSRIGDVYITGTGTWERGISADGLAKNTGALGIRTLQIGVGCQIFQCTEASLYLSGVKNCTAVLGSGLIPTPSSPSLGALYITGDATVTTDNVNIVAPALDDININRCINVSITAPSCGDITIGSFAQNSTIRCNTAGTVTNNGSATTVERNSDHITSATLGDYNFGVAGGTTYGGNINGVTGAHTLTSNDATHTIQTANGTQGDKILSVLNSTSNESLAVYQNTNAGANAAAAAVKVGTNSATGRSVNAGGTVNASGADYAEYERKRADCGVVEKGDIVGFDADGLLTDQWDPAISFGIKSTNPAIVGGDAWAPEDIVGKEPIKPKRTKGESNSAFNARLIQYQDDRAAVEAKVEAERVKYDRIAYAGKVPVNVTGAMPGQWVVPVRKGNGIGGEAKDWSAMTEAEREITIGRVRRILPDKRAEVNVR